MEKTGVPVTSKIWLISPNAASMRRMRQNGLVAGPLFFPLLKNFSLKSSRRTTHTKSERQSNPVREKLNQLVETGFNKTRVQEEA